MASIEVRPQKPLRLPDGTEQPRPLSYRVKYRDPDHRDERGRMFQQSFTFDDRDEAERFKRDIEDAGGRLAGIPDHPTTTVLAPGDLTIAEMVEQHITYLTGIEDQTRDDYRSIAALHINPQLGRLPAGTIARDRIREWINWLDSTGQRQLGVALADLRTRARLTRSKLARRLGQPTTWITEVEQGRHRLAPKQLDALGDALDLSLKQRATLAKTAAGMSPKTLRNVHSLLSAAFTWAVEERELRLTNPARGIRLPRYDRPDKTYLTPHEFSVLLRQFDRECYRLPVRFLAATGVRWGELIAITIGDLHLDVSQPYVSISKAVKRAGRGRGQYVGTPKSVRSRRLVSLPPSLAAALRDYIQRRHAGQDASALLFTGPRGARLHYNNFRDRQWTRAVRAAAGQIPKTNIRIHDLRHTHASWLIMGKADMLTVQRRLGHESITTTYNTYGHLDPRQMAEGAAVIEDVFAEMISPPDLDPIAPVLDLDDARDARDLLTDEDLDDELDDDDWRAQTG